METCWICRKKAERVEYYGRDQLPVCADCADEYTSIAQCSGYDGYDCQAPVLGEDADDELPLCQECREHYWEQDLD